MNLQKTSPKTIMFTTAILLIIMALITVPHDLLDATDVKDYTDTAKFFAGDYAAGMRTSHSMAYGLLLSPYVALTHNYFLIKFSSVFFLFLIILSVYYISNKNKNALWLIVLCPLLWYMSPWVSPLPLSALIFLWVYYFLKRFDEKERLKDIIYAGLLMGVASVFWDTSLYFSLIFLVSFLYDKKFYYIWIYLLAISVALIPRFLMDYVIFDFALFGIVKNILALIAFSLYGGSYNQGYSTTGIVRLVVLFLFVPIYFFKIYLKSHFKAYKKEIVFLTSSLIFLILNPQVRLILTIAPIVIIFLAKSLNNRQLKIQAIIFFILSLLVITPYIIQGGYEMNHKYLEAAVLGIRDLNISYFDSDRATVKDLSQIARDYPDQVFVVGNENDNYRILAHLYWGKDIKEFISIEDYNLYLQNKSVIASKEVSSNASPEYRREIFLVVGIRKNSNDNTSYNSIKYAISFEDNIDLDGFNLVKRYDKLYLWEKPSIIT